MIRHHFDLLPLFQLSYIKKRNFYIKKTNILTFTFHRFSKKKAHRKNSCGIAFLMAGDIFEDVFLLKF